MVRKLNELYKASVVSCQGLSLRLQRFFLDKQRLLDRIQSVSAEKLIFSHAVQTVRRRPGAQGRSVVDLVGTSLFPQLGRCSPLPWMRCSIDGKTVSSAITRPCCSWRGCSTSSATRRMWRILPSVSARGLSRMRPSGSVCGGRVGGWVRGWSCAHTRGRADVLGLIHVGAGPGGQH